MSFYNLLPSRASCGASFDTQASINIVQAAAGRGCGALNCGHLRKLQRVLLACPNYGSRLCLQQLQPGRDGVQLLGIDVFGRGEDSVPQHKHSGQH